MFLPGRKLLSKYEIREYIGSGRFAEVYRAKDLLCDRIVAIKSLRRGVYAEEAIKYVISEFRAMGMLWGHPNIVSIHSIEPGDLVWDDKKNGFTEIKTKVTGYLAYIVMEFVDGQSLDKILENGRPPIEDALNICLDICNGLAYAHENRIIHRDVKPQNVLISKDGVAKVGDFSIARLLEDSSYVGSFVGTSKYMAPEQYDGHYNHQVDIYATGLLFFESVIGSFPFDGQTRQELEKQKKRNEFVVPEDIPEELEIIIRQALQADTKERYQTIEEMHEAIHEAKVILYEETVYGVPIPHQRQLRKKWRFSGEDELISSLRRVAEEIKSKEEELKGELNAQIKANKKIEEEFRHHREAKAHLEEVVHDYIHETQKQNDKIQELQEKNDYLITSLSEQEEKKNKLVRMIKAARREVGKLNRKLEQSSPRNLWIRRIAITVLALISIGLMITMSNFSLKLNIYKKANQIYETQIIDIRKSQFQKGNPLPTMNTEKDSGIMVLIPEGNFIMGDISNLTQGFIPKFLRNERTNYMVYLDNFYIDKHEVTNAQYVEFLNSVKRNESNEGYKYVNLDSEFCQIEYSRGKYRVKRGYDEYPVVEVSWYGAHDYANWADKRLPTEAEWEKAARGGLVGKKYPWDDRIDPNKANYGITSDDNSGIKDILKPIGSFEPNRYGLYDVAGNVWEWVQKGEEDADTGSKYMLRGGGWDSTDLNLSKREYREPDFMDNNIGFRCAKSIDDE